MMIDKLPDAFPPDPRCCDNCAPDMFPVDTIILEGEHKLKTGRLGKSPEVIYDAVLERLRKLRQSIVERDYPNQHFITGRAILQDNIMDSLAERAILITSAEVIKDYVHWIWSDRYGDEVYQEIKVVRDTFPELLVTAKDREIRRRAERLEARAEAEKVQQELSSAFEVCDKAVSRETYLNGQKEVLHCQPFLRRPSRKVSISRYHTSSWSTNSRM